MYPDTRICFDTLRDVIPFKTVMGAEMGVPSTQISWDYDYDEQ